MGLEEAHLAELREEARLAEVHMAKELELQEGYLIEAMDALKAKERLVAGGIKPDAEQT